MTRYADPFLNALMYPHQITVRGELYFEGAKVDDITFMSGNVDMDRSSTVRRNFNGAFDPRKAPKSIYDKLTPFGAVLKVFRGIRWPDGRVEEYAIFYGRVEFVEFSRFSCTVRATDLAANISDARFEAPRTATKGMTVIDQMKALITDVLPDAIIDVTSTATQTITTPATWDRERDEALDNLAGTIAAEWYAGPDGHFKINPLPALGTGSAVWIVDAGDTGTLITRDTMLDRTGIYNAVVVNGEPPDGTTPAYGIARDTNPASLVRWGGPFGKVPKFYSSQFITTNAQANQVALDMLADAIAGVQGVRVTCVPNPRLLGGQVVQVKSGMSGWDGLYFINAFTLPLMPEEPMSMACNVALESVAGVLTPRTGQMWEDIDHGALSSQPA